MTVDWVLAADGVLAADPEQLLPARQQMAFTLGFHIILVRSESRSRS